MRARDKKGIRQGSLQRRQRGVLTTFTAIVVLVLLALMMVLAVRAGVFEQRDSANDARQKLAFHVAESGIEQAKEYIRVNSMLVGSYTVDLLPDGTDGWLAAGSPKWLKCSDAGLDLVNGRGSHPCFGESVVSRRADTYFFSENGSTNLPLATNSLLPTGNSEQVAVQALLCVVQEGFSESPTTVEPCTVDPDLASDDDEWMITFLARGESDCTFGACNAEALIADRATHGGAFSGGSGPDVPLVTKSSFPPSGTAEIVPNPDAGGEGVPLSLWVSDNDACSSQTPVDPSSGSWATCQMHEWYGQDSMPDDVACPGNCSCTRDESISYTHGNENVLGYDLVEDEDFPCDLFAHFFGVPRAYYEVVKSQATIINDCSTLDANSFGLYWATGSSCQINSNVTVGSPEAPVTLISASSLTKINGGAEFFGILYVADVEDSNAILQAQGNNTVYGTVIVDASIDQLNGTFQVVYNENAIRKGAGGGQLLGLAGGWTDFHRDWE